MFSQPIWENMPPCSWSAKYSWNHPHNWHFLELLNLHIIRLIMKLYVSSLVVQVIDWQQLPSIMTHRVICMPCTREGRGGGVYIMRPVAAHTFIACMRACLAFLKWAPWANRVNSCTRMPLVCQCGRRRLRSKVSELDGSHTHTHTRGRKHFLDAVTAAGVMECRGHANLSALPRPWHIYSTWHFQARKARIDPTVSVKGMDDRDGDSASRVSRLPTVGKEILLSPIKTQ